MTDEKPDSSSLESEANESSSTPSKPTESATGAQSEAAAEKPAGTDAPAAEAKADAPAEADAPAAEAKADTPEEPASTPKGDAKADSVRPPGKGKKAKKPGASATPPPTTASSAVDPADKTAGDATGDVNGEERMFPLAPRFDPAKPKLRDWILTLVPTAILAYLMMFRGDVLNPRGTDPGHALGHYRSLLNSGHIPGSILWGLICVLVIIVGLFGLMGDSPLDLRGNEKSARDSADWSPWYRREGLWLVGFAVILYVPLAGAYGLWDPWETHYSEVAREMLARDDWITLWWGQEGWFMSKPILIFYLAALGMGFGSLFGLPFWRDMGPSTHEWYIRLPIVFLAILAVYAVYRAVSSAWGRRAGLLCGMVLATMPHWFFLSHQAMTDMPFVAPLVIAMSFLMLAVVTDSEKLIEARAVKFLGRQFRVSFWHLAVGAIILVALPQVMYLLTRPMIIGCAEDADRSCRTVLEASRIGRIQFPIEQYWSGSAANSVRDLASTVPGSPAWEDRYNQVPFATSFMQGLVWCGLGAVLLFSFRRERRIQPLAFAMVYLFGAISFMGKGPAGLGVPEIVLLGFMITTGRWKLLPRIRLFQAIGIFLVCGFPWYIGIYCRLGSEYFDRFVVHDLLNRAFAGVHGDTGTFKYFIWQLGYAMFPWTGLVPAALIGWKLYVPEKATEQQKDIVRLALLWFLVTFTLFSMMVTKFHHYIFPAVPSCALLVGLLLHRMLGDRRLAPNSAGVGAGALTFAGVAMGVLGITNFFGAWHGAVSRVAPFVLPPGNRMVAIVLTGLSVAALIGAWMLSRKAEVALEDVGTTTVTHGAGYREGPVDGVANGGDSPFEAKYGLVGLGAVGVGAAVVLALIARDIGWVGTSRPAGFERFIHLFVYNYDRPFPTRSYDYHAILDGFGIVAVIAASLLAVGPLRRHAARMMIALAACFGFWALDKYMIDLSHHWSQRTLFDQYYARRNTRTEAGVGEDSRYWADPLAAYQMNWKGENFYTGNHAAMLECGLPLCRERTPEWLTRHRGQRVFFVTEHSRSGSVISQVRTAHGDAHTVTTEYDNNKFVLIEANL